jgi:hypothetical protein
MSGSFSGINCVLLGEYAFSLCFFGRVHAFQGFDFISAKLGKFVGAFFVHTGTGVFHQLKPSKVLFRKTMLHFFYRRKARNA